MTADLEEAVPHTSSIMGAPENEEPGLGPSVTTLKNMVLFWREGWHKRESEEDNGYTTTARCAMKPTDRLEANLYK